MGLEKLLRNSIVRTFGLAAGLTAGLVVVGARDAGAAELTVPIGGVYVSGSQGSDWHDQQLLRNTSGEAISGDLYCVERSSKNQNSPGFDPATSPSMSVNIPANSTTIIDDVYNQMTGGEGACALWLATDGETSPIWRSRVFNQLEEGQNGMTITASDVAYSPAGFTLSDVLSGDGMRDGLFLESGPDGVSGYWKYANAANGNETTIDQDLGPNKTFQWTGTVRQMLGFEPEAGAQLDYVIEEGSANAYLSRTDNETNDGAWNKFEEFETPSQANYNIEVQINVSDNGQGYVQTTSPSEEIIKKVWQVNTIPPMVGTHTFYCHDLPDGAVNTLDEIADNYNNRLSAVEQNEFSGDRVGFADFVNDSDGDGSVCDSDETDNRYLTRIELRITEQ